MTIIVTSLVCTIAAIKITFNHVTSGWWEGNIFHRFTTSHVHLMPPTQGYDIPDSLYNPEQVYDCWHEPPGSVPQVTGLWRVGAAVPQQLWSWWPGLGPAAGPAGRRLHQGLCPSPARHPPPWSRPPRYYQRGQRTFLCCLNTPDVSTDEELRLCVCLMLQRDDALVYHPGVLKAEWWWQSLCWLQEAVCPHRLVTVFVLSASHTEFWDPAEGARGCTPPPCLRSKPKQVYNQAAPEVTEHLWIQLLYTVDLIMVINHNTDAYIPNALAALMVSLEPRIVMIWVRAIRSSLALKNG